MDELYVIARRVLLDALEALGDHRKATILVGAQAIYLHTGAAELGVAEYTTDADLVLDPALLGEIPPLEQALEGAGFYGSTSTIGIWKTRRQTSEALDIDVRVDILMPATVSSGSGRRAARLTGHGVHAARKVDGLEGVLVDQAEHDIASLEPEVDGRVVRAKVAGPGALLVAKLFKIHERRGSARANDKDALDVLRVLQAIPVGDLGRRLRAILVDPRSAAAGSRALELFDDLFANRGSKGAVMAARATQPIMDADQVRLTCEVLAADLRAELGR
ncbi:MAG: hypothetical protein HYV63_22985 [Candidatus Schekmanbacteria bacterium]|nr:hypothetical protein [Candidatus Schekmanbacteria bacterium]